ncbi:FHS family glucose/mannose:H+ symporter-like MFS transporter [Chryseobacterium sp. H1D6B]|uniref:MFS transporter n=1 Tax=Chryseobacterium sp. H1D6B TaxID=2940588 RepID=UPI0015CDAFF9|nr:MFS transporter [Chryseobacterium sp. H1D6B]MDH6253544.1 FHS family glucose/mannose:H+ symporter-like MFS transporter [Chryseobacterium sp. H1D6B]
MNNKLSSISLPLKLTFLIFSMVLNCMGIVILQLADAKITYEKLGFLESFKDLPIAFISLFAVNFISKIGTKKSLILALGIVGICSCILPFVEVFWFYKLWFAIIGTCFAIGKICVFGIIRNNISDEKSLAKTMNSVEASFMVGIFVVNTGFGWLISSQYSEFWKFGFLFISVLSIVTLFLFSKIKIAEPEKKDDKGIISELSNLINPLIISFLAVVFFIVFIEQSFNSWLPSFYKNHLKVNSFFALQATSFLALFSYAGRTITANIIQRFSLSRYFIYCLSLIVLLLISILGLQYFQSENSKALLFLFPVVGLFLSPLYPVINSKMIAKIDKEKINLFTSLIVIFSSLGSSISSIIMSLLFGNQLLNLYPLYILVSVIVLFMISLIYFKLTSREYRK